MNPTSIIKLNEFPKEKYNVLVPVTTMQAASNLQKVVVSEVVLDTRTGKDGKIVSKDIYYEKSSNAWAITKVGGMKLAAAANISIVSSVTGYTECCKRCIEMARAAGTARTCGNCHHVNDVAVTVTIRVPEPAGGFRMLTATKEIDVTIETDGMSPAQTKRFIPHRTAIAESKAFMRAIRAALGLAATYNLDDLKKPFVVARIVPNLDAPEIKQVLASNYLQSMGLLFEAPAAQQAALPEAKVENNTTIIPPDDGDGLPVDEDDRLPFDDEIPGFEEGPGQPEAIFCTDCRQLITGGQARNGRQWTPEDIAGYSTRTFGRILCTDCQRKQRGGGR